jgi:hemolysin activation/secretion protein
MMRRLLPLVLALAAASPAFAAEGGSASAEARSLGQDWSVAIGGGAGPAAPLTGRGEPDLSDVRPVHESAATVSLSYAARAHLPGRWRWDLQMQAQWAGAALPQARQAAIGDGVRGYHALDGSYDEAVVWRQELRPPPVRTVSPYLFADLGAFRDRAAGDRRTAASAGFGATWRFAPRLDAALDGAWALSPTAVTRRGDLRLLVHAKLRL